MNIQTYDVLVLNYTDWHFWEQYGVAFWWLHVSENPSSILCVVSGHLCTFLFIKTYFQALFILLCQIKHYHNIPYQDKKNHLLDSCTNSLCNLSLLVC